MNHPILSPFFAQNKKNQGNCKKKSAAYTFDAPLLVGESATGTMKLEMMLFKFSSQRSSVQLSHDRCIENIFYRALVRFNSFGINGSSKPQKSQWL